MLSYSHNILALVLEITLKSFLVAALVLSVTWTMRRSSAAVRHLYLSVAVIALLLLPLVSVTLPSWNVGFLPNPFAVSMEAPRLNSAPVETGTTPPAMGEDPSPRGRLGTDRSAQFMDESVSGMKSFHWILLIWMVGGGFLLVRLLSGKMYGYWIAYRAPAVEDERILDAVKRVSEQLGLAGEIPVVQSDHLKVPFVSGLFRPRLILPSQVKSWPLERIEAILHHEFAHIKRKDILVQFIAKLACCLYWINPLAWITERKLFIERERACDDIAINRGVKASEYAEHLMEVMEDLEEKKTYAWVMPAMAEGTDFKDRILSVLDPVAKRTTPRMGHAAAVIVFSILLLLPLASLYPWAKTEIVEGIDMDPSGLVEGFSRNRGEFSASRDKTGSTEGKTGGQTRALITLLESPDAGVREHAATAHGKSEDPSAVPALIKSLDDRDASVREHVAMALGNIGDKRAVSALARITVSDSSPRVREHAAIALGQIGDEKALPELVEALRFDSSARVREHAAIALGQIGDKKALPDLIEVVRFDSSPRVREHAASAVGEVGGEEAYENLVHVYENDENIQVRAHGAYGLGLLKDKRAFDLLVEGLNSRHPEIRSNCAEALGLLGDRRAEKYLKELLRDSSRQVRESAARALRKLNR